MIPTKLFERSAAARARTRPIGRVSTLIACLLAVFGFAFSADSDGPSGALDSAPIECESSESESSTGDSFEESQATQLIRRLRPRDFERALRFDAPALAAVACHEASPIAAARPAMSWPAGRDLLIRQQRFLI